MGRNDWSLYFYMSTNYGTYIQPENITTRKKGTVVWPAMFFGGFKLQPEKITTRKKQGTVVWPTDEIPVFWRVQITTGNNYEPKKKVHTVVWPTVEINIR